MTIRQVTLPCPCCATDEALRCKVVITGEGFWVSLQRQTCACQVYADWDTVWWHARHAVKHMRGGTQKNDG